MALAVSLTVAGVVAVQMLFGFPHSQFGWFAYSPGIGVERGEPMPMPDGGVVVVDADGGVTGEAVAAALSGSLDPSGGRLRCRDVRPVTADATSVCTHDGLPAEKVVVVFLDDSGRFVWTVVLTDVDDEMPQD
jgi:hypothetical protein